MSSTTFLLNLFGYVCITQVFNKGYTKRLLEQAVALQ